MSRVWLPPSARGFEEIAPGIEVKAIATDEQADRLLGPDDGIFLSGKAWWVETLEEPDQWGRTEVPSVFVDFERLRQQVIDGTVDLDLDRTGIQAGFATAAGEVVAFPDGPKLHLETADCHVYVGPIAGDDPDDWLERAKVDGYCLVFEAGPDGRNPYLAISPFKHQYDTPIVLPPKPRGGKKAGRNQPCPCGSGLKFKRCCGS